MATMRLKISDGTTTIDLYGGTDCVLREGGLDMPPPAARTSFISSPFFDGATLASSHYENRTITLTVRIDGTTLADLQTNVRQIQRVLNDATKRTLLGYGAQYYLEVQWGDSDNQSTFFDVLRGDLVLPSNYMNTIWRKFSIVDAQIALTCKPFGRYTNQTIAQDTLENSQSAFDIKESYLTGEDSWYLIYGAEWAAQTFQTSSAFTAKAATIKCYRVGTITTATFALYATTGGVPSGNAIATGSLDVSALDADATYIGWTRITFVTPVALSNATTYALVVSLPGGSVGNTLNWGFDSADGALANGQKCHSHNSGTDWTAEAADDFVFAIFASETASNYQDITTSEGYGDVLARLYLKLAQTSPTGTKKVWIAKRSGTRQTDDLWVSGEELTSITQVDATTEEVHGLSFPDTAMSGEMYGEAWCLETAAGGFAASTAISYLTYTISTPPRGQFRVLCRCKVNGSSGPDYAAAAFGFGWSYGSKTYTPSEAKGEYIACAANNTLEVLDLGLLNLPPVAESDIASNSPFYLRIYQYALTQMAGPNVTQKWDIDFIMLLPIDEGVAIIASVLTTDIIAVDGISDPQEVFIIDSNNKITNTPDYVGAPFSLGRESTRIYVLRDDVKGMSFTSDITYQPLFLIS